jgi:hypothetical protein
MSGTRVSCHDEQQPLADLLAFLHSKETKKTGKKEQGRSGRP